jgi:hypothetical protein
MQVNELCRERKQTGETVVELETGKLRVRLINTYANKKPLDEILYIIACHRLAKRLV